MVDLGLPGNNMQINGKEYYTTKETCKILEVSLYSFACSKSNMKRGSTPHMMEIFQTQVIHQNKRYFLKSAVDEYIWFKDHGYYEILNVLDEMTAQERRALATRSGVHEYTMYQIKKVDIVPKVRTIKKIYKNIKSISDFGEMLSRDVL